MYQIYIKRKLYPFVFRLIHPIVAIIKNLIREKIIDINYEKVRTTDKVAP